MTNRKKLMFMNLICLILAIVLLFVRFSKNLNANAFAFIIPFCSFLILVPLFIIMFKNKSRSTIKRKPKRIERNDSSELSSDEILSNALTIRKFLMANTLKDAVVFKKVESTDPNIAAAMGKDFLVVIDFAKIPKLEDFPQKGILKISDTNTEKYEAEYLKNKGIEDYLENNPMCLKAKKITQEMPINDLRFIPLLEDEFPYLQYDNKDVLLEISQMHKYYTLQCGGYPTENLSDDILLFQIDTLSSNLFKDNGVLSFFIKREDLINRNFSNIEVKIHNNPA